VSDDPKSNSEIWLLQNWVGKLQEEPLDFPLLFDRLSGIAQTAKVARYGKPFILLPSNATPETYCLAVKQSPGFNIKRAEEITRMSLLRDK